jgi:hypothetical protein
VGIVNYKIYVSENDKPYELWYTSGSEGAVSFTSKPNATYKFYSEAEAEDGRIERAPDDYDAITTTLNAAGNEKIIHAIQDDAFVVAYPNPARDQLHFRYKSNERLKLSLYTLQGKVLSEFVLPASPEEGKKVLSTTHVPAGLIVVRVESSVGVKYLKLIFD